MDRSSQHAGGEDQSEEEIDMSSTSFCSVCGSALSIKIPNPANEARAKCHRCKRDVANLYHARWRQNNRDRKKRADSSYRLKYSAILQPRKNEDGRKRRAGWECASQRHQPWGPVEDCIVTQDRPLKELADLLGRSHASVDCRRRRLKRMQDCACCHRTSGPLVPTLPKI